MPAVSSPTVARLSFSRSCSSRSLTAVRSVNRQIAPCSSPLSSKSGDTVTPRCVAPCSRLGQRAPRAGRSARCVVRHSSITSDSAGSPQHPPIVARARRRFGNVQHPAAGGIEDADLAVQADDEQAGGQARDDLAAQPLGGLGARRRRALLRLQLRRPLPGAPPTAAPVSPRLSRRLRRVSRAAAREAQHARTSARRRARRRARSGRGGRRRRTDVSGLAARLSAHHRSRDTSRAAAGRRSRRSAAPSARNVPNGSAYFMSPRCVAISPTPMTDPASDAIISVTKRQLPAEEGADHRQHLHVAHPEAFLVRGCGSRPPRWRRARRRRAGCR